MAVEQKGVDPMADGNDAWTQGSIGMQKTSTKAVEKEKPSELDDIEEFKRRVLAPIEEDEVIDCEAESTGSSPLRISNFHRGLQCQSQSFLGGKFANAACV